MSVKNASEVSSTLTVETLLWEQDPNVAEYLANPQNPLWVTEIEATDTDGAKLAIVRNDPHYWAPCHIVRVDDGEYAQFAPWQIVGDVFERDVDWKSYICVDQWPDGIAIIDPKTLEVREGATSMTWKLKFVSERDGFAKKVANLF